MNLSELQSKDIVSVKDGTNLGRIIDARIDEFGKIIEFIAQDKKFLKKMTQNNDIAFSYQSIKKIGSDVILIDI